MVSMTCPYTDDSQICESIRNLSPKLYTCVSSCPLSISPWVTFLCLKLSMSKTVFLTHPLNYVFPLAQWIMAYQFNCLDRNWYLSLTLPSPSFLQPYPIISQVKSILSLCSSSQIYPFLLTATTSSRSLPSLLQTTAVFSHFFFFNYMFGRVGSSLLHAGFFFSCSEQGLLFIAVHGLLIVVASLVVEHGH